MKKNLFLSAAAVCVAVAFAACSSKPAEEATEEVVAEPVEEVAEEAVEAVDTANCDTIVAVEGVAAEAAPVAE